MGRGRRGLDAHSLALDARSLASNAGSGSRHLAATLTSLARPAAPVVSTVLPLLQPPLGWSLPPLGSRAESPTVRSCRGALLWPWCTHAALLAAAAGAGPERGRAGGDTGREARVGSAPPSPPTGVSHLPRGQIRGRGRWRADGNRAKESEESTATGLGIRAPPNLTSHAPRPTLSKCPAFTHKQLCSQTNIPCPKFRHIVALFHIWSYTNTTELMAYDHEGNHCRMLG